MNEFDLRLEFHLRRLLGPGGGGPVRPRRKQSDRGLDASAPERLITLVAVPVEAFF